MIAFRASCQRTARAHRYGAPLKIAHIAQIQLEAEAARYPGGGWIVRAVAIEGDLARLLERLRPCRRRLTSVAPSAQVWHCLYPGLASGGVLSGGDAGRGHAPMHHDGKYRPTVGRYLVAELHN